MTGSGGRLRGETKEEKKEAELGASKMMQCSLSWKLIKR